MLKVNTIQEVPLHVSRFIAGLLGITFLAAGLALFMNYPLFARMLAVAAREPLLVMLAGFLSLLAGVAIIQVHNVWKGWPVLVSLIGWLAVVTGVIRVVFPIQMAGLAALFTAVPGVVPVMAGVLLLLGAFLTWKAYARA
ncbi:MAG TPA: hypothetical protein VGH71_00270 [Gammaproteobacteria bacterium]|jgi:hypothetical protein